MAKQKWRKVKNKNFSDYLEDDTIEQDPKLKSASLMDRFKAFLTDTFLIMMPIMYLVFYIVMGSRQEFAQHMGMGWVYIMVPHFIATIGFWKFAKFGQTPGQKAYEVKIVDSSTGEKAGLVSLINRYIFTSLSMVMILPLIVPYINKERKTLQDIVSNTTVVYEHQ
jgi:uncharacterized RDD family membrane protein YckC